MQFGRPHLHKIDRFLYMAPPFELKCRNFTLDLEFIGFSSGIYFVEFSGDHCRLPGRAITQYGVGFQRKSRAELILM